MSKKVAYQFDLFKGDDEVTPELDLLSWVAANSSSEVKLVVDYFKIPANQTSDLSLSIVQNSSTKLILLHDPSGSIDSLLKVKLNGGSTEYSVAPDLLLSEVLTSVSATNTSSGVKELYIYSIVANGVTSANISTVNTMLPSTFLQLIDTPSSYAGAGGKTVKVKSVADGLEFVTVIGDGVNRPIVSQSTSYTITSTDGVILGNASGGAITFTLPNATGIDGRLYTVKKTDSSANAVILDGHSSQTIDGSTTYNLTIENDSITVIALGGSWYII